MDHLFGSLSFFVHNQLFQLANEAWNPRAKLLPVYFIFFLLPLDIIDKNLCRFMLNF